MLGSLRFHCDVVSIQLSVSGCVYLSDENKLSAHLVFCLSACLSVCLSVCLICVCLLACLPI